MTQQPPDTAHEWGGEHFCAPDVRHLYDYGMIDIHEVGYPKELDDAPHTFCARCLQWFRNDNPEGVGAPTPHQKGQDNGRDAAS